MNNFKTLALGAALLLTATVETQAVCVECPTGIVGFNCNKGTESCKSLLKNATNGSGTWIAQTKNSTNTSTNFSLAITTAGLVTYSGGIITCTYGPTSSLPKVTLTWMSSQQTSKITCVSDTACGENQFSCS